MRSSDYLVGELHENYHYTSRETTGVLYGFFSLDLWRTSVGTIQGATGQILVCCNVAGIRLGGYPTGDYLATIRIQGCRLVVVSSLASYAGGREDTTEARTTDIIMLYSGTITVS